MDETWLRLLVLNTWFDEVLHLAAQALINDAIRDPGRLFRANLAAA